MLDLGTHTKLHASPERPTWWQEYRRDVRHRWTIPFHRLEWCSRHVAWALSRWSIVQILEHLGTFSLLIAVIFYFHEAPQRRKIKLYQAWRVINTAQGIGPDRAGPRSRLFARVGQESGSGPEVG